MMELPLPKFINKEIYGTYLTSTGMNDIFRVRGILAGSYISSCQQRGTPIPHKIGPSRQPGVKTRKVYLVEDVVRRAVLEGYDVTPRSMESIDKAKEVAAEVRTLRYERDSLIEEIEKLSQEKEEKKHKISTDMAAKTLSGATLLTQEEIVNEAIPFGDMAGIYFLIRLGLVVYVGQSVNVMSRIQEHSKWKDFDHIAFVQCEKEMLDPLESLYIHTLRPPFNGRRNSKDIQMVAPMRLDEVFGLAKKVERKRKRDEKKRERLANELSNAV